VAGVATRRRRWTLPVAGTWELRMRDQHGGLSRRIVPLRVPVAGVPSPQSAFGLTLPEAATLWRATRKRKW